MNRSAFLGLGVLLATACGGDGGPGKKQGVDKDGDGATAQIDCDDDDPSISPNADDPVGDGLDTNCDQVDGVDADGDGVPSIDSGGLDCDDTNPAVAGEDVDGDGAPSCIDCNDADPAVSPFAVDACNGVDDDCDGAKDLDAEGRGTCASSHTSTAALDLLFVVDDSCSMENKQAALVLAASDLLDGLAEAGTDFQIGVTTTDMQNDPGQLVPYLGELWAHNAMTPQEQLAWLEASFAPGNLGSPTEEGRDAAYAALAIQAQPGGFNDGFVRPSAHLAVVFFSDEEDASYRVPMPDFRIWFTGIKPDVTQVSSHAIVTPDGTTGVCPDGITPGLDYITLAIEFGGLLESICEPDLSPMLHDIGSSVAGTGTSFTIDAELDPTTLTATLTSAAGSTDVGSASIDWAAATSTATLLDHSVGAGDTIVFHYALI